MHCYKIKLKSGQMRWVCVEDGPPDPVTGERKQVARRGKTQREAKERVEFAIREIQSSKLDISTLKKLTFEELAEMWMETYSISGVKDSTIRIRRKELNRLYKHMAKTPVISITHAFYQQVINKLAVGSAQTTVEGDNTTAGMVFEYGIKNNIIDKNPKIGVVIPKKRKTVEEIESDPVEEKYLERNELDEFLKSVIEHGLELDVEWFYLLAFSGMRSGELLALKWSDLDFNKNAIRITKTIYNPDNNMRKYKLTPPKTKGSIRTITMEDEIMKLLKSQHRRQSKIIMKYRHELEEYHDGNFVFARSNGYPYIQKNIISRMKRLLRFTDIEKYATPHIFRHSHISMLTEAGVDLPTIMEKVGHDDMKTTMKIYTHVTNKMKKDASAKVRSLYENTLSQINL